MELYVIEFYLYCDWKDVAPTYRLYLDDELMTERTYIWHNNEYVLQERIPAYANDEATIRIEQVGQHSGEFSVKQVVTNPPGLNIKVQIA
jgi:hypothetical protein